MSLEQELTRVAGGAKNTLKALISKLGGTVGDEAIDAYPTLVENLNISIDASEQIDAHNDSELAHPDIRTKITETLDVHNASASAHMDIRDDVSNLADTVSSHAHTVLKEINTGADQKFWRGTKEEFDAVETKSDDTLYIVTDEDGSAVSEAAVQSDWAQNDETADDYVKNRFGGYYQEGEDICVEEATCEFTLQDDGTYKGYVFGSTLDAPQFEIINCDIIRIVIDEVSYVPTHTDTWTWLYESDDATVKLSALAAGPEDYFGLTIYTSLEGSSHTVTIYMTHEMPMPIPEEFVPALEKKATKESVKDAVQIKEGCCATILPSVCDICKTPHMVLYAFESDYDASRVYKSVDDGKIWTIIATAPAGFGSVAYGDGNFIALPLSGKTDVVYYSNDAITWTEISLPASIWYGKVAFGAGRFVVVSTFDYNNHQICYSDDGITWIAETIAAGDIEDIQYIDDRFVVARMVHGIGCFDYSTDGIDWSEMGYYTRDSFYIDKVVGGDGKLLMYNGQTANVLYSIDSGETWLVRETSDRIYYLTYNNGVFIYVTSCYYDSIAQKYIVPVYYSDDLINWTKINIPSIWSYYTPYLQALNQRFMLYDYGIAAFSEDGQTWEYARDVLHDTNGTDVTDRVYAALKVDSVKPSAYLTTLTAADWDGVALTQTVTVPGIQADESKQMIIPMPTIACMTVYNEAGIQLTNQADNALTFTAQEVPAVDIQVYVSFQDVNLVTG